MSNDLTGLSATELARLIRLRTVSPVEVVEAHLRRIDQINPSLNAIVTLADDAIDRARAAEARLSRGDQVGLLHGLPLTIKDTIDVKGLHTTSGSSLLADNVADRDATAVARLKSAGAIIVGKTNVAEMAAYYESDNRVFGRTNNPYDLNRTAGGSSGGEASAIAACLSPAGIGSDLAGSIRLPAHFCGIVGLKPTSGRVPVDGHTPAVAGPLSLGAAIGPLSRTIADLMLLFEVMADNFAGRSFMDEDAAGERRAVWYVDDGVSPVDKETAKAVQSSVGVLREAGWKIEERTPPGVSQGFELWMNLFSAYVANQFAESYRGREDEAGPQVAAILGRNRKKNATREARIDSAEHLASAIVERERTREELLRWMKRTPIIIAPVGATSAWLHGTQRLEVNKQSISVFRAFSYSQTFNVFGFPSVAVPAGRTAEGLPIGVQIIGRPFAEHAVLSVASLIEQGLGGWSVPAL